MRPASIERLVVPSILLCSLFLNGCSLRGGKTLNDDWGIEMKKSFDQSYNLTNFPPLLKNLVVLKGASMERRGESDKEVVYLVHEQREKGGEHKRELVYCKSLLLKM